MANLAVSKFTDADIAYLAELPRLQGLFVGVPPLPTMASIIFCSFPSSKP